MHKTIYCFCVCMCMYVQMHEIKDWKETDLTFMRGSGLIFSRMGYIRRLSSFCILLYCLYFFVMGKYSRIQCIIFILHTNNRSLIILYMVVGMGPDLSLSLVPLWDLAWLSMSAGAELLGIFLWDKEPPGRHFLPREERGRHICVAW